MRRHGRVDANQSTITEALRAAGATVVLLSPVGSGVPDLLVGYHGENYLLEVKTETGKLTHDQDVFFSTWRGQACVVRSASEALAAIYSAG